MQGEIEVVVDLMEYRQEILKRRRSPESEEFMITFPESLVTSTKEFIKNIIRKIFEKYNAQIKP